MKKSKTFVLIFTESFTLLEILIVIGIISILIALGTVSYSSAQKKARDTKRQSDIHALQNCFEQYYSYNDNFEYPVTADDTNIDGDSFSCGATDMSITDPRSDANYHYVLDNVNTDLTEYQICAAKVETTIPTPCVSQLQ